MESSDDQTTETPAGRPTRSRQQPKRFVDEPAAPKQPAKRRASTTTVRRSSFNPSLLLSSSKSKLIGCDLVGLFADPDAWTSLSRHQRQQLIEMMPPHWQADRIKAMTTANDQQANQDDADLQMQKRLAESVAFREDVRVFQENLADGKFEARWLADAHAAFNARMNGDFADWERGKREEIWGPLSDADQDVDGDEDHNMANAAPSSPAPA